MLGWQRDLVFLDVFPNTNDSVNLSIPLDFAPFFIVHGVHDVLFSVNRNVLV